MNSTAKGPFDSTFDSGKFEATLRLIASLPAPEGLEERVQAGLCAAARTASPKARILRWPEIMRLDSTWMQSSFARTAAAAAIVCGVVAGSWVVSSRVQPAQPSSAISVPPRSAGQGGFSSAVAKRKPQTLNGPMVEAPTSAHLVTVTPQRGKPTPKTAVHRANPATAGKAISQSGAPEAK